MAKDSAHRTVGVNDFGIDRNFFLVGQSGVSFLDQCSVENVFQRVILIDRAVDFCVFVVSDRRGE